MDVKWTNIYAQHNDLQLTHTFCRRCYCNNSNTLTFKEYKFISYFANNSLQNMPPSRAYADINVAVQRF